MESNDLKILYPILSVDQKVPASKYWSLNSPIPRPDYAIFCTPFPGHSHIDIFVT